MHTIMAELHRDHLNLAALLRVLAQQAELLLDGSETDLWLMNDIADYICRYSDTVHHPKEDEVYHYLTQHTAAGAMEVAVLLKQHQQLPAVTLSFKGLIAGALQGSAIISRKELATHVQTFITAQRSHMDLEESTVFPLIAATLQAEDWELLQTKWEEHPDPLFGQPVLEGYEALYDYLQRESMPLVAA